MPVSRRMKEGKVSCVWLIVLLGPLSTIPILSQSQAEWPNWRGPNLSLTVLDPDRVGPGRTYRFEVVWKKPLGNGYSPISVSRGIAVTGFSDETGNYFGAFDAATGEEKWRFRTGPMFPGRFGAGNGPISTPLIAGQRVFVLDNSGAFYALNLKTGRELWSVDFVKDLGAQRPFYGYSTSPLPYRDSVIVQTGGRGAVTRFNVETGEVLWTAGTVSTQYQTPTLTEIDDKAQIVLLADQHLLGIDSDDGEILWKGEHGGQSAPTGSWTSNPVLTAPNRVLVKTVAGSNLFQIVSEGGEYSLKKLWETHDLKNTYVVSVVHNDLIYGFNNRILNVVDAKNGQRLWRSRKPGDGFPIVVSGHLIFITKQGRLSMAPASREEYSEVASLQVFDDLVWTPPSYVDGHLYLRSFSEWARVDVVESEESVLARRKAVGKLPESEFGKMVARAQAASEAHRKRLLDDFLSRHKTLPIIEGKDSVHFVYRGEAEDVALVSDLFGGRTDRTMHRIPGTDFHYFSIKLETDARINYSFLTDFGRLSPDPLNPRAARFQRNASVLAMPDWRPPSHLEKAPESKQGTLEKLTLESEIRGRAIELTFYLPHNFSKDRRYPVAYILDSNEQLSEVMRMSLDNLVGTSVEPLIAVFVPYFGSPRIPSYFEYVDQGLDSYMRVLVEEIIPLVDASFPTVEKPEGRAFLGRMNTTYSSVYTVFKNPGIVGKLGLQTMRWEPGLRSGNRKMLLEAPKQHLTIYFDWGKYDGKSESEGFDARAFSLAFAEDIKAAGYSFTGGEVPDGAGPDSWLNRTDRVLEALFPLEK